MLNFDKFIEGCAVKGIGEIFCEDCDNVYEVMGVYEMGQFTPYEYICPDCGREV